MLGLLDADSWVLPGQQDVGEERPDNGQGAQEHYEGRRQEQVLGQERPDEQGAGGREAKVLSAEECRDEDE